MKLFYKEIGEGNPIVILHGVFGSSDNLLGPAKLLADEYKVYLLDQRNHGNSPHSDEFNYSAMASDLMEFLDEEGLRNPLIVGHSMGGKVVMNFAAMYPEFDARYVVMDISPRFYKRHHDEILKGLNNIDLESVRSRQEADKVLEEKVSELPVRQFLLKNLDRTDKGFKWRINLPVLTDKIDNIGEGLNEDIVIDRPFLFIRGDQSNYIREKDEELIRRQFTDSRVVTIHGAGHWLHAEKPEEFAEIIKEFIKTF